MDETLTDLLTSKAAATEESQTAGKLVANRYRVKPDGTVKDEETKLMWMQSPLEGRFTFDEALQTAKDLNAKGGFASHRDWRVPSKGELASLVAKDCCPSICQDAFPNTPSTRFWTSTPSAGGSSDAWNVNFLIADVGSNFRTYANAVRLVRK